MRNSLVTRTAITYIVLHTAVVISLAAAVGSGRIAPIGLLVAIAITVYTTKSIDNRISDEIKHRVHEVNLLTRQLQAASKSLNRYAKELEERANVLIARQIALERQETPPNCFPHIPPPPIAPQNTHHPPTL